MAPTIKKSQARILTARLNPIDEKPREKRVLEIIEGLEAKGFNFKEIMVDAILRADGATPEMFDPPVQSVADPTQANVEGKLFSRIESMFAQFAEEIVTKIAASGIQTQPAAPETDETNKQFAANFAQSFLQRQRNLGSDLTVADDEDE